MVPFCPNSSHAAGAVFALRFLPPKRAVVGVVGGPEGTLLLAEGGAFLAGGGGEGAGGAAIQAEAGKIAEALGDGSGVGEGEEGGTGRAATPLRVSIVRRPSQLPPASPLRSSQPASPRRPV